ncbi:lipoprotein-releasing ABC transporter permease subunit [Shewanella sp. 3B26]|uniref:Lipoprotein-releasing ABC transporter permease subunit n=1 Tax=Shewanella zhuhaiensis TaxID=2919576 RepID=A0AAJ1BFD3_9GAMM|nr:lipoprotein-releasing ABC transporter permease subunit [Shewanella zhuhaiensis]MCH4293756.1 lipoprotein-releasing ABC transporter permease subunit [Shewanella zhuhaiensis]
MFSSSAFLIGFRYWRARKANAFASFITLFAVSGIFLGVAALIVVSSVMNGLEGQLKSRILGAVPQLVIENPTGFDDWQASAASIESAIPSVLGISPSAGTQAMLQSSSNIAAVQLQGIYPQEEARLSKLTTTVWSPAFETLKAGEYHIILGTQVASELDVAVGDTIRVLSGEGVVYSPLGPVPSQRKFVVSGLFQMGSQVDGQLAFIHYDDARRLMRKVPDKVDMLRLYLDDPFKAEQIGPKLPALLATDAPESLLVHDWRDTFGHLFGAVKMEKNMMSLMLSLIVAVAAFNIVSALVMMVVDKTTDVAVLMTQGLKRTEVMGIFVVQGSMNALLGLVLGLSVGTLLTLNLNPVLNGLGVSVLGAGQQLPVIISAEQLGLIVAGTIVITLLATLYPALKASRVEPATALRYE